jgi:hypothetical protein
VLNRIVIHTGSVHKKNKIVQLMSSWLAFNTPVALDIVGRPQQQMECASQASGLRVMQGGAIVRCRFTVHHHGSAGKQLQLQFNGQVVPARLYHYQYDVLAYSNNKVHYIMCTAG